MAGAQTAQEAQAASINEYLQGNKLRQSPNTVRPTPAAEPEPAAPDLNQIELGPVGPRGAAAALQRLEEIEFRSPMPVYCRLSKTGNPFKSRRPRNSICGPVRFSGDWICRLKPNAGTLWN